MYLTYRVRYEDAAGNELREPEEGYLPPEKDQMVMDSSKRRLLYSMRFLVIDPRRLESLMGPWLCRQHPGASEITMTHVTEAIPPLDVAVAQIDTPVKNLKQVVQTGRNVFNCQATLDEVSH